MNARALEPSQAGALIAALALAASPGRAHAFSELARFAEPAVDGGGEGRYFTGAPPDGLACGVCHTGGPAPRVTIEGLPAHLAAGTAYRVSLTWPDDGRLHALALELVDDAGHHPAVTVPADQPAAARCTEPPAATAIAIVDVGFRRIVTVAPCGARALDVAFTPASDAPLYLGAAFVASDGSETAAGDGVLEVRRTLTAGDGGCSAGGVPGLPAALALLGLVPRRRARRSRAAAR